eukprot:g6301.t1
MALAGADVAAFVGDIQQSAALGPVARFTVGFPLVYHYVAGIRHVYWDKNPEALTNEDVYKTSVMVMAGSLGLSGVLAFVTF